LKEFLKNQLKKIIYVIKIDFNGIKFHKLRFDTTDNFMVFNLRINIFLGKKYLLIKHRNTGKRISKPVKKSVKNYVVKLSDHELENMGEIGIFDIYLKTKFGRFEFVERTKYESINNYKYFINKKGKTIFRPYKTAKSNLSFTLDEALFNYEITSLESDQKQVRIEGVLSLFEDIIFDSVELASKSNEIDENKIFGCEYRKKKDLVFFNVKINLEMMEVYRNNKWNLYIRLKNKDIIIFEESLLGSDLRAVLFK
jgi:hypothetical protein